MKANITEQDLVYNIIFDIPKEGQIEVNKFTEGMKDCLMALDEINHAIAGSVDNTIQVVSYIEALESGSLIYKLKDKIKNNVKEEDTLENEEQELPPQTINAHIKVYKPCFEKTDKWQFTLNGKTETIDISESDLISYMKNKWVNGDTFYVKLEFVERATTKGYTNDYKVIEVLKFTRGSEQVDLFT